MAPLRVLGLVFPNFDIMDLTGPSEVFGSSRITGNAKGLTIASATENTSSSEDIVVKRQFSLTEALDRLTGFDVIVMPGGLPASIQDAIDKDKGLLDILKKFAALTEGKEKWMLSVCTGALFLGTAGLLGGRKATTHWGYVDVLEATCSKAGGAADVMRKRFVDAGKTESGVRIVTAGGVSCGVDAALWIVSSIFEKEKAVGVANSMDHRWEFGGEDVKVTEGWIV